MPKALETTLPTWIETFQSRSRLDLLPQWERRTASGCWQNAAADPWGGLHRPDWQARGLLIWPRGGLSLRLRLQLHCPEAWRFHQACGARLALRWWAIEAQLRVDGLSVHRGDLYDSACRWLLPPRWWQGEPLELELELCSPLHDDGALILSRLELEPLQPTDPEGLLLATGLELEQLRQAHRLGEARPDAWGMGRPWAHELTLRRWPAPRPRRRGPFRCWAMPTSIWPGCGRWPTPGRPPSAPSALPWR